MAGPGRHRRGTDLATTIPLHHHNPLWILITWPFSRVKWLNSIVRFQLYPEIIVEVLYGEEWH